MPLTPILPPPGVVKDDTALKAGAAWSDGDKVRFYNMMPEPIGGWQSAVGSLFQGICRNIHTWADLAGNVAIAYGTHLKLYVLYGGAVYDITPIRTTFIATNPFTTSASSAMVTVALTGHGLALGDFINVQGASAVGGITLSGQYQTASIVDANTFTIAAASIASSGATGGGTVIIDCYLPIGNKDGLSGAGYGTGGDGLGPFGGQTAQTLYPRTWSLDNWGQNLLASPRGGSLYQWIPDFTTGELVQNSTFASSSGWTLGAGWSIAANTATHVASNATDLSQSGIQLTIGNYYRLTITCTVTAGTFQPKNGSLAIGAAISATGTYVRDFTATATSLVLSSDATHAGTITLASIKTQPIARIIATAPAAIGSFFVTPERQVVCCGASDEVTGVFNPMLVRHSDQNDNSNWTTSATTQAGQFPLAVGGRIVRGLASRGQNLIWTDSALYVQRYLGDSGLVFSYNLVGRGCGLIGPNAAVEKDGVGYWMANTREFLTFAGGAPQRVQSDVKNWIFDNVAFVQEDKVHAGVNSDHDEIWFFYPDRRDGTNEVSRYAAYQMNAARPDGRSIWHVGTFTRTAWRDAGVLTYPLAADVGGQLYYHEIGNSADGAALACYIESGYLSLAEGNEVAFIDRVIPDFLFSGNGAVNLSIKVRLYPSDTPRKLGPYAVLPTTRFVTFRARGRDALLRLDSAINTGTWRLGHLRANITASGRR